MFLGGGYLAVLTGGDGPHAQRLAEYMREKFGVDWSIEPVLRDNLDEVLAEMRITEVKVSVPAERITRELVGGDWYSALESGKQLVDDGIVRIGMSVGQRGDRTFKQRMSDQFHARVEQLRQSFGLHEFKAAKVTGSRQGNSQTIDLIEDRLVETVEVEEDRWFDSNESTSYAADILVREIEGGPYSEYRLAATADGQIIDFNPGRSNDREVD